MEAQLHTAAFGSVKQTSKTEQIKMIASDLIKGPVGMVLGLIVWLTVFSLIIGAINGWFLQTVDAGVISGERFDRVMFKTTESADADWALVTSAITAASADDAVASTNKTTAFYVQKATADNTCVLSSAIQTAASGQAYTPLGTEVTVSTAGVIAGCEWQLAGGVFTAGGLGGLVKIILQAAGLAPPIALLFALGSFGQSFMRNMGSHPILAAVLTVILLLLVATLLNTFVPFLSAAFEAIDKTRFRVFDEGLGNLSVVVGNFYGVVVVASMMMIAWQVVKQLRGGNVIDSASKM